MTSILSWNIQCGLGCDGIQDLSRIADQIKLTGNPDVICLQEISRFMPELDQNKGEDQVDILGDLFPEYEPMFGAAIDRCGTSPAKRQQFGNLVLSRLPIVQAFFHPLPQPHDAGIKHMPRQLCEVVVECASGPLRILTTHLEYHSENQRMAQVSAIHDLHQLVCDNARFPGLNPKSGPYHLFARPETSIICGDFNFTPGTPEYMQILSDFNHGTSALIDAWCAHKPGISHDPTCGIFDKKQWSEGPHARDFFFITQDLKPKIKDTIVNTKTNASDHQPLLLTLDY